MHRPLVSFHLRSISRSPAAAAGWLAVLLATLLAACSRTPAPAAQGWQSSGLPFSNCQVGGPGIAIHIPARCTSLKVYEDRQAQSGKQISLNIAVIPAVSRSPDPDPVFFLAGGPGEAATQSYVVLAGAFQRLNLKRDIVLVDQRGTGQSNKLDCPDAPNEDEQALAASLASQVQACLAKLPGDPRFYTTPIAMDDLDQVRQALGYTQINLYGASYGTRAALVYARQYPQHVRTLVLDGVVPLDWSIGPDVSADAQHALDLDFARCAADPKCGAAFPGLAEEFTGLLKRLETSPAQVSAPDLTSGKPVTTTFGAAELASTVHLMSYTPETIAMLPLLVHQAYAWQDYRPLASQASNSQNNLSQSISGGMRLAVLCTEDAPFWSSAPASTGYLGDGFITSLKEICSVWPKGSLPPDFKKPVVSTAPALLISGEVDPITPPRNATQAAQTLPEGRQVEVPGHGHVNVSSGCMPVVLFNFIEKGSTTGLDTSCLKDSHPLPFFLNLNGPTP